MDTSRVGWNGDLAGRVVRRRRGLSPRMRWLALLYTGREIEAFDYRLRCVARGTWYARNARREGVPVRLIAQAARVTRQQIYSFTASA